MPDAKELELCGTITKLDTIVFPDNRIGLQEDDLHRFKSKLDLLEANHAKSQPHGGFLPAMRKAFIAATNIDLSYAFIYHFIKLETSPRYWNKNTKGYIFVAWVLNLPDEYVPSSSKMVRITATAVPAPTVKVTHSNFNEFVDAHAHEIQTPLIEAWKQITAFYNIDVVLESLRRLGLNDSAIAALSKAAAD